MIKLEIKSTTFSQNRDTPNIVGRTYSVKTSSISNDLALTFKTGKQIISLKFNVF